MYVCVYVYSLFEVQGYVCVCVTKVVIPPSITSQWTSLPCALRSESEE